MLPLTDLCRGINPRARCLQHPYLTAPDIEPTNLSLAETHEKLVSASAKLMMLRMLLPKLKARGHRVLLFSQVCCYPPESAATL